MKTAAERILRFTAGETAEGYVDNEMLRSAVERQYEIMGEALGVLRREFPGTAILIADLPKIVGFRNVLIHRYDDIRDESVWQITQVDLPPLLEAVTRLLDEAEPP